MQRATYRISEATQTEYTFEELLRFIHTTIGDIIPATNFYIALYDEKKNLLSWPYFVDEVDPPPKAQKPGKGLTEYVLRTGKPLLATPAVFEELVSSGEVEAIGAPSIDWMGVPLMLKDKPIGVLVVQSYSEGVRFTQKDVEMLSFVSSQVAMSIDRRRGLESLRESEARFRALFENSNDAIFLMRDEEFIQCNRKTEEIFGGKREQILGRTPIDLSPEFQRGGKLSRTEAQSRIRAAARGTPQHFEWQHTRLDGSVFDAEVSLNPMEIKGEIIL